MVMPYNLPFSPTIRKAVKTSLTKTVYCLNRTCNSFIKYN